MKAGRLSDEPARTEDKSNPNLTIVPVEEMEQSIKETSQPPGGLNQNLHIVFDSRYRNDPDRRKNLLKDLTSRYLPVKVIHDDAIILEYAHEWEASMALKYVEKNATRVSGKLIASTASAEMEIETGLIDKFRDESNNVCLLISVCMDTLSACSLTSGLGRSPYRIGCYSRHGNVSYVIPPYSFLKDGKKYPLLKDTRFKMKGKENMLLTEGGKETEINIDYRLENQLK